MIDDTKTEDVKVEAAVEEKPAVEEVKTEEVAK